MLRQMLHPWTRFMYLAGMILLPIFLPETLSLTVYVLSALVTLVVYEPAGKKLGALVHLGKRAFLILGMVFGLNLLFGSSYGTPLVTILGKGISRQMLYWSYRTGLFLLGALFWFQVARLFFSGEEALGLFHGILPSLSLMVSSGLRELETLETRVRLTRETAALNFPQGNSFVHRMKESGRILLSVMGWSAEHGLKRATIMNGRGYGAEGRHEATAQAWTGLDLAASCLFLLLFFCTIQFWLRGLARLGLLALCCLPMVAYGWEEWKWRKFVYKR